VFAPSADIMYNFVLAEWPGRVFDPSEDMMYKFVLAEWVECSLRVRT